jgi:hypothetical protein
MIELTDDQRAALSTWIEEGEDLSGIQRRLKEEFGIGLTYFETRMLADDLKLRLKDPERPAKTPPLDSNATAPDPASAPGKLSLTIDQITRPGALVSGRVTFSDGENGAWYLDQTGRLGLDPNTPGYRPNQQDLMDFQAELEKAARAQGL